MSRHRLFTLLWSLALIALGIFGLLYNFGVFDDYRTLLAYVVAGILAVLGVVFLAWLAFRREHTAFVVPGISLLTLAVLLYLLTLGSVQPTWLAALFLAGMAIGYLVLFLTNRRERWWALLQAGTIAVIALVGLGVGVPPENQYLLGTALFGGFALSYLLLFLVGGDRRGLLWALIMAAVLGLFAMTTLTGGVAATSTLAGTVVRLWPLLLVLVGAVWLARLIGARPAAAAPAAAPPTPPAGEPAQIVRPDAPSSPESRTPTAEDPAAALDRLLEASPKPRSD
ncbi:MAG: hypothetical protein RMN24_08260 [Anaerolineae bacterium]|nr:hypothetical protein [Anaerolineae bacterium]